MRQAFAIQPVPKPESGRQRRAIQLIALLVLAASVAYLIWRVAFTVRADYWLAVPLWLLEVHAVAGLALYTFSLWDLDSSLPPASVVRTDLKVAILIPTYNEEREVLLPTVAASVDLEPAHETWILDDGERPWVRLLAAELGARYLARPEHTHAKAGNLNYALDHVDAEIIGVLDADHVPNPEFLTRTLGYFEDPRLAVVQTPQDFYNVESFEHDRNRSWFRSRESLLAFNEQRLFYRALQPGKNRWNAAFWCGTSALVRVSALRDVGGVAQETITEDIHTTIRMHRKGWRTVFHNEVLAYGLAAGDAEQYQVQRTRWGVGAMQLLRLEHPLTSPGLSLRQRLAYAATLLGWFDAWRSLGYVLLPLAVLFSGASPITAPLGTFALVFGTIFVLQRIALAVLGRGYAPQGMAILFEFIRMPANLRATLSLLGRRERAFAVTAKGGSASRSRGTVPKMLWVLVAMTAVAGAWYGLTLGGLTPTTYPVRWTAHGAAAWAVFNVAFLFASIARIRSGRYSADRRNGVRLRTGGRVLLNNRSAELLDLSVGGALVRCKHPVDATANGGLTLELTWGGDTIVLDARERTRLPVGAGGSLIGIEFAPGQDKKAGRLVVALLAWSVASSQRSRRRPAA